MSSLCCASLRRAKLRLMEWIEAYAGPFLKIELISRGARQFSVCIPSMHAEDQISLGGFASR
jgi:hypothetical protein